MGKRLVIEYFRRRFVVKDYEMVKDSHGGYSKEEQQAGTKMIWSPFHFPILMMGMLVNDEVFIENGMGWNEWSPMENEMVNYKWIQFEYLHRNTLDSVRTIRCWMSQGLRIDNTHCEFERDEFLNDWMFSNVRIRKSKGGGIPFSDWYSQEIGKLFTPCSEMVVNGILSDRPQMLLGQWTKWEYLGISPEESLGNYTSILKPELPATPGPESKSHAKSGA